ncbi:ubiquitin-like domain-containing protein [Clostridium paridis]|uniref:DUF348 domain-containing protein n=1 Tax=Clostridium paridis TaxID=2803863 RepID=A0A937K375_9CLOT|nr:ubiquitin-like domain-containing protein [Clostridium paridis]MBL4931362.1 DUF348 domain-containing protein [Clostridium paridis]
MNINKKTVAILASLLLIIILVVLIHSKQKNITLVVDNENKTITTYENTVEKVLDDEGITLGKKDRVEPALDSKLQKTDKITVIRAMNLIVTVDGKDISVLSAEDDISNMLESEGISLGKDDKVQPEKTSELSDGMKIKITRVDSKTITETVATNYTTIVKSDNNLLSIFKKTTQSGVKGKKEVTYKVLYEDGKEISREAINEKVVTEPVNEVVVQGTQSAVAVSRGGEPMSFSKKIYCRTTAYWAVNGVGSTYTASGRQAVRNSEGYSTVAVDPSVISFGTKMYIPGYGFAIAADSGSGVKGNTIDVFFNTKGEALNWAVKNINVYILD